MAEAVPNSKLEKRTRTRSPAYPYINLESAITRAEQFYGHEGRNAANVNVAATDWGFVEGSSNAAQTIAALISFGLLRDSGVGEKRTVQITQNALRILLDKRPDSEERAELIKNMALSPKIHQQLWGKWGTDLPSDAQLRHTLLFEWETPFNENAVDYFIKEYKDTIAFAKLADSDIVNPAEVNDNDDGSGEGHPYLPKIGDYVQWESQGVLQFPEPKKLREFSADGKYGFVEGSYTGILVDQLIQAKAPLVNRQGPTPATKEPHSPLSPKTLMQEFVVPLSDGSRAVFQWPSLLSKEDVDDLKDSLRILERKIDRSTVQRKQDNDKES